ncbi:MAG: TdeIII family type II restriction endonuclease [Oscillospiraceae bacterium]|nr:TdeIII family type II restriction endonuclease [Oscillospiraceae bacterium]
MEFDIGAVCMTDGEKRRIETAVRSRLTDFAKNLKSKHTRQVKKADGIINLKKRNVFISKLPGEFAYYSALVRSFDSSFGGFLEKLALEIARENYEVSQEVVGKIDKRQLDLINDILNNYKNHNVKPEISHYESYSATSFSLNDARHASDHLLYDKENGVYHIVELKAGGDLDNKKAEAEKRALLEQYFILKNGDISSNIKLHFATAYNKFGEENKWVHPKVEMFFASDELLIGRDFWNFVCKDKNGFNAVIKAYNDNIYIITQTLDEIKKVYDI